MLPRPIAPRLKLDIGWGDLIIGVGACLLNPDHATWADRAEQAWDESGQNMACLSIRTGFDLLLQALDLPEKSEVLLSAITIAPMAEIIRAHGLTPVPVDLDPDTLQPVAAQLEQLMTPRTRILLVAHLFGSRLHLDPLVEFAARHDLMLVEDCAQSFTGGRECTDPRATVSMLSFGPIKTATALGGAILVVRHRDLIQRMRQAEARLPVLPIKEFVFRLLRFSFLKFISLRPVFGLMRSLVELAGRDLNSVLGGTGRAFPRGELLKQIRHRPPAAMLRLLARRLRSYDARRVALRAEAGRAIVRQLNGLIPIPGVRARGHTFWVFPITAKDPKQLARYLLANGFDCTPGASAMCVIEPPAGREDRAACPGARQILDNILYLPVQPGLSPSDVRRLGGAVLAG